jgi:hypothetical protein
MTNTVNFTKNDQLSCMPAGLVTRYSYQFVFIGFLAGMYSVILRVFLCGSASIRTRCSAHR